MRRRRRLTGLAAACAALALGAAARAQTPEPGCGSAPISLQVLGSGGPDLAPGRAGSSYLVWLDGRARVLIDAGGGAALRFAASGARASEIHVVLLTHLHVDHTADFATLVGAALLEKRERPLPVYGPVGN